MWETHRMLGKELADDLGRQAEKIDMAVRARKGADPATTQPRRDRRWMRALVARMPRVRPG